MTLDEADDPNGLPARRIRRPADDVDSKASIDVVEGAVQLAEFIERRRSADVEELARLERASVALGRACSAVTVAATLDEIMAEVCPAAIAITESDFAVLSRLDQGSMHPLASTGIDTPALKTLIDTFRLPHLGSEADGMPVTFTHDVATAVVIFVDGKPTALVHVDVHCDSGSLRALLSYGEFLGAAIELSISRDRMRRQSELIGMSTRGIGSRPPTTLSEVDPVGGSMLERTEPRERLTDRELEVHALLLDGASNAVIASKLFISVETVRSHVKRILHKRGVSNRTALIHRDAR